MSALIRSTLLLLRVAAVGIFGVCAAAGAQVSDIDVDGDGIVNAYDLDVDGDGLPNATDFDDDGDGTLDANQIPALNLVAHWPANGNANDVAGSHHGTPTGGLTYGAGRTGLAFCSDGTGGRIEVPSVPSLGLTNTFTLAAWIFPTSATDGMLFHKEQSYEWQRTGNGSIMFAWKNTSPGWAWTTVGGANTAPLNTWTHFAFAYDNGVTKTYRNGALIHTQNGSGAAAVTTNPLHIGARFGTQTVSFNGCIDDTLIYNRALSAAEAAGISGPLDSTPTGLGTVADIDNDGILNALDVDMDGDGVINVLDPDANGDGVTDGAPIGPGTMNDFDGDGVSNNLDPDLDGDGTVNVFDPDIDGDSILNTADTDDDNDGILDGADQSPQGLGTSNDLDEDGIPNAVDIDIDGDTVPNAVDNDVDGDGIANTTDTDDDNDGILDAAPDLTPVGLGTAGDIDGDGTPNELDMDIDGDGIINVVDLDTDGDGAPNATDLDDDNDNVADIISIPTAGKIAHWLADGTAVDVLGGNSGTATAGLTYGVGYRGSAFSSDGTGGRIVVAAAPTLDLANTFTIAAWIHPTGSSSDPLIFHKNHAYEVARENDGRISFAWQNTSPGWVWTTVGAVGSAPLNTWTHLAFTYENGVTQTFINGVLVNTQVGDGVVAASTDPLHIGGRGFVANASFNGSIDDPILFSRALTAAEISSLGGALDVSPTGIGSVTDYDGDGLINANDTDIDGDGILNPFDADTDGDSKPNTTDLDDDDDGTPDTSDPSPTGAEPQYAPSDIALSINTITENQPSGTVVGALTGTDSNPLETLTFSLVSGGGSTDNANFRIVGNELRTAGSFDFESKSTHSIRVRVTDNGLTPLSYDEVFTIIVTDLSLPQTVAFAPLAKKVFGDAPFTLSATGGSSGQPVTFSVVSGSATLTGGNLLTITAGGSITVRASQAGVSDYAAAVPVERTFSVAGLDQTISFPAMIPRTVGDAPFPVGASATSGLIVFYNVLSGPAAVSGSTLTLTGTGTVTIRASQSGNANFNAAVSVTRSFDVAVGDQAITFGALPTKSLGTAPFAPGASTSSGLPVIYSIVSGPGVVIGDTIALSAVGTVTVRASQPGNGNYNAASSVERSFEVLANPDFDNDGILNGVDGDLDGDDLLNGIDPDSDGDGILNVVDTDDDNDGIPDESDSTPVGLDPNSAPTNITLSQSSVPENMPTGTVVGTLLATDANPGQPHTFTLVSGTGSTNNASFTIAGTALKTAASFNFEAKSSYSIRVRAMDNGLQPLSVDKVLTVTITDVFLPQTITFPSLADRALDAPALVLSATGGASGQAVVFSVVGGPASIRGKTLSSTALGTVTVRATQAGSVDYSAAIPVERSFQVVVGVDTDSPVNSLVLDSHKLNVIGDVADGEIAGTYFRTFGIPTLRDDGSFLVTGTARRPDKKTVSGIVHGRADGASFLHRRGDPAPGISGATLGGFSSPFLDHKDPALVYGVLGYVTGKNITLENNDALWTNAFSTGGELQLIAREGSAAPGWRGAKLVSFISAAMVCDDSTGTVQRRLAFIARVAGTNITAANDTGLWIADGTEARLVLRKGGKVQNRTIAGFSALASRKSAAGHGHGFTADTDAAHIGQMPLVIKFTDSTQAVGLIDETGVEIISATATSTVPGYAPGAKWNRFASPTRADSGFAVFAASIQRMAGQITARNDSALFADTAGGVLTRVAAEGESPLPSARPISRFESFVNDSAGAVLYSASAAGHVTLYHWADGTTTKLAGVGDAAPGTTGTFKKFHAIAMPDGLGPVFVATAFGSGVASSNDTGVWVNGSDGTLRLALREGQPIGARFVSKFRVLAATTGSASQSRSFNGNRQLLAQVYFAGGGASIVRIDVP